MKKLIILTIILCGVANDANAYFRPNSTKACYIDDTRNDEYWFCGRQSESCDGVRMWRNDDRHWLYHGENFDYDGHRFWCCGGTGEGPGKFVETDDDVTDFSWFVGVETVAMGNGRLCKYNKYADRCGNYTPPCTVPDPTICANGYVLFQGTCVQQCEIYASKDNPTCVTSCQTDEHSGAGMVAVQTHGTNTEKRKVCMKCDPDEFFTKTPHTDGSTTYKCTRKSDMIQYTKEDLKSVGDVKTPHICTRACNTKTTNR